MEPPTFTVLTWNLQGARGVDVLGVAAAIRRADPDVVLLQEVQRRQAHRIARVLGLRVEWRFKNLSGLTWPEGLAVMSAHELRNVRRIVLRRAWFWHWRRRIAVLGHVDTAGGVDIADLHLSAHADESARRREAALVATAAPDAVVGGDFNDRPGGGAVVAFTAAGWRDAWAEARPGEDGPTNWTEGPRAGRPPTQRLDYVLVPTGWNVESAEIPVATDDYEDFATLSDHLPLVVTLRRTEGVA